MGEVREVSLLEPFCARHEGGICLNSRDTLGPNSIQPSALEKLRDGTAELVSLVVSVTRQIMRNYKESVAKQVNTIFEVSYIFSFVMPLVGVLEPAKELKTRTSGEYC